MNGKQQSSQFLKTQTGSVFFTKRLGSSCVGQQVGSKAQQGKCKMNTRSEVGRIQAIQRDLLTCLSRVPRRFSDFLHKRLPSVYCRSLSGVLTTPRKTQSGLHLHLWSFSTDCTSRETLFEEAGTLPPGTLKSLQMHVTSNPIRRRANATLWNTNSR